MFRSVYVLVLLLSSASALAGPVATSPAFVFESDDACDTSPRAGRGADLDGDGLSDIGMGWYGCADGVYRIWRGTTGDWSATPDLTIDPGDVGDAAFGYGSALDADVNGDGTPDLVLANYGTRADNGLAVYLGERGSLPSTPSQEIDTAALTFGTDLATGDFDADGYDDVAVGAYASAGYAGAVEVYMGGVDGVEESPSVSYRESRGNSFLGIAVATGDINADGYDDLVLGASGTGGDRGLVAVYLGGPDGLGEDPDQSIMGEDGNTGLGAAIRLGDVNGDGHDDAVVDAQYEGELLGEVRLFLGSDDGLSTEADQVIVPDVAPPSYFGHDLEVADYDRDGYADVATTSLLDERAWIYPGGAAGVEDSPEELEHGPYSFAWNITNAGDVNGDDLPDLLVTGASGAVLYLGQATEGTEPVDTGEPGDTGDTGETGETGDTGDSGDSAPPEETGETADSDTGAADSRSAPDTAADPDKSGASCACSASAGSRGAFSLAALAGLALLRRRAPCWRRRACSPSPRSVAPGSTG